MILTSTRVRVAQPSDQMKIADLLFMDARAHRHLDWRAPLEWLGEPAFWVLTENERLVAALAMPPDPPGIAWLRLFAHSERIDSRQAWSALWPTAREYLRSAGVMGAAIALQPWLEQLLREHGFLWHQDIVLLEWDGNLPPAAAIPTRRMTRDDLPAVAALDAAAFEPLWRNSLASLQYAYPQALWATVVEGPAGLLGYQITTRSPWGAHLARLAVHPQAQGRGIGYALVRDLMTVTRSFGLYRLTVNTQSDNRASLALYARLGFRRTGEQYPVYLFPAAGDLP